MTKTSKKEASLEAAANSVDVGNTTSRSTPPEEWSDDARDHNIDVLLHAWRELQLQRIKKTTKKENSSNEE